MVRVKVVVYGILIFIVIVLLMNTIFMPALCKIDFIIFRQEFLEIANELSQEEISFVSISKKGEFLYKGKKNEGDIEILSQSESVKKLFHNGYERIEKTQNGIYFRKQFGIRRIKEIMYYPNGFSPEENGLVTYYKEIEKGWYYAEER